MKQLRFVFFLLLICTAAQAQRNYAALVNPFIGTGGHGHTFPGAVAPFGMVQLSPDTRINGDWDGCSGYHYSDSIIYGFSHTHLSGTGCSDYGDIMLMPVVADLKNTNNLFDYAQSVNYRSLFSHQQEVAQPGYYKVQLNRYHITAELTTSTRVGMHRYQFPETANAGIVLDLTHRDETLEAHFELINDSTVRGYRYSKAWASNQKVFFYLTFSTAIKSLHSSMGSVARSGTGKNSKVLFLFDASDGKPVTVKVAISGVDMEGAQKNLQKEIPHWNFDLVRKQCEDQWNRELSKIDVKGGSNDEQTIFYTALYHCFIHPSTYSDVDFRYRGRDDKIYTTTGFTYYTVFSLWDTFRALHPLFNIIQRERNIEFINTFLAQYQQVGLLPIWELSSNETNCMIGNHAVSVIADALAKGNNQFNLSLAREAAHASLSREYRGLNLFRNKGYLEIEDESESVSNTLEYAYNDWCMLQILALNKQYSGAYQKGAHAWKNVFHAETGFMRPRSNGGWYSPFNPTDVNNHYTEANSWQYSFFVPHDIEAMIGLYGGAKKFEEKLDALFSAPPVTTGRNQADITGLIGQYAHGNEPSHHMAYLYNYINKPEKTQRRVHQILSTLYHNSPDGLSGNEDCGQMSAWYVMSAIGLYDVCPGGGYYAITKPHFNETTINGASGKIKLRGNDNHILTLEQRKWKSQPVNLSNRVLLPAKLLYASFNENTFNTTLAEPIATSNTSPILRYQAPIIVGSGMKFKDSTNLMVYTQGLPTTIQLITVKDTIVKRYHQNNPIHLAIKTTTHILVKSLLELPDGTDTLYASAYLHQIPNDYVVSLNCTYNRQYSAGGPEALVDGLNGYQEWRKGGWQGYQNQDFDATIDLKETKMLSEFSASFLQDSRSWILFPKEVTFYVSDDGKTFTVAGTWKNNTPWETDENLLTKAVFTSPHQLKAHYVKIIAKNFGKLPEKHVGYGGDAFIFIDEVDFR